MKISLENVKKALHLAKSIIITERIDEKKKAFIKHNEQVWGDYLPGQKDGEILLESIGISSSIIAFSYLTNLLAKRYNARITSYQHGRKNIKTRLENRKVNRIYTSFNVSDFIYHDLTVSQEHDVGKLFEKIVTSLKSKRDVEGLSLEDVWIGDLLYDSHCMNHRVPTIDVEGSRFRDSLRNAICSYVFWRDYLDTHQVHAVIVSHTVYIQSGVITRLAVHRGIPVYQINAASAYLMSRTHLFAYNDFFDFPEEFRKFTREDQESGLIAAKERLSRRFNGEVGVDMSYSSKSAFVGTRIEGVLSKSPRIKILIATHCFFDSPHPYGVNLFPDCYEWLSFLAEISEKTDYEWYIKTHPDFLPGNIPILREFTRKYPKFVLIPAETSVLQLIEDGIDFALTVYGTIGFEYAALGVPVVNASTCNPHVAYNFNFHPKTVEEYENILLDLPQQKLNVNMNDVYEYYYMKFIDNVDNWLFKDYKGFLKEIGGACQTGWPDKLR